ncbi:glycoside hydrolase family 16 protein [Nocardioides ultimimeridianus]
MRVAALLLTGALVVTSSCLAGDAAEVSGPAAACGGERPVDPAGGTYTCTFSDDFDGTAFDDTKWMQQDTSFSGMTSGNQDCFVASPDVVSVSDGAAHISARRLDAPFTCHSPLGDFTSQSIVGTVATRTHFAQTYGRFEFRARFPDAAVPGVHSALWLYPAANTYGPWPASGEVDVAEWYSSTPTKVYPSAHYAGEVPFQSSGWDCGVATPHDFHTYAVDWTPSSMYFYVDDHLCWQHSWLAQTALPGAGPFDQPFYVVLTQVFGSATNAVSAATPAVATTDVDWVRVFGWNGDQAVGSSMHLVNPKVGHALSLAQGQSR